jgi:hypothetical protein
MFTSHPSPIMTRAAKRAACRRAARPHLIAECLAKVGSVSLTEFSGLASECSAGARIRAGDLLHYRAKVRVRHALRELALPVSNSGGATFPNVRGLEANVSLVSLDSEQRRWPTLAGRHKIRPDERLAPKDVVAEVSFVISFPSTGCPTAIQLHHTSP